MVNSLGQVAKKTAEILIQYEQYVAEDWNRLMSVRNLPKIVFSVYEYLKRFPITTLSYTAKHTGLSFNSVSKDMALLNLMVLLVSLVLMKEIAFGYIH